ncbi:hypothetical protein [Bowmanella yangjiangensis]|uniref:DUF7740 domain-containing protein n=1 Tax=Bowmanella yangjiangensis TaxID=2811230 RepID=A0ABS3CZ94_9ALTE|nr:hypothetical protein [Bowmanella yangjiangensis]MBN7822447.1 hypothetical protein [Bowmanella yangjiangensis]
MSAMHAPAWAFRTRSSQLNTLDAAVCLALALRIHMTDEAVRKTAGRLRDMVPIENRAQMSKIMRHEAPSAVVELIIKNATGALGL